jgi:hypothetical protein
LLRCGVRAILRFVPFRTAPSDLQSIEPPARLAPPRLLGFAAAGDTYRALYENNGSVRVVEIDRRSGHAKLRATCADAGSDARGLSGREHWAVVFKRSEERVAILHDRLPVPGEEAIARGDLFCPVIVEQSPCIALSREGTASTHTHGPRIDVVDPFGENVLASTWHAPSSARHLLAATCTVFGPATIYSTDRVDEIDVCASGREGAALQRTVSLGWKQQFESAQGGGSRIMVVSRDPDGIVVRTLASDVRSELNPVPIRPRTGWAITTVCCAYANGPFVVGHTEERDGDRVGVLTVFDAGQTQVQRLALPGLDAIGTDGKDVCAAVMVPSASVPVLMVHRSARTGANARYYAFFLEEPDPRTTYSRHSILVDVADIVSRALGSKSAIGFELRSHDELGDSAHFVVPGLDKAHDIAIGVLLREDGSGVTSLRIGGGNAPEPRALHFAERLREMFSGDDDGDAATTRVEHPRLAMGIESIVSAVGALRAARGA